MSIFKGHFASSLQENHQFFCDETLAFNKSPAAKSTVKLIKQLGLVSFTKRSCKSILEASIKYVKNTELYSKFPDELKKNNGNLEDDETILDYCEIQSIFYTRFNKATLTFEDVKTEMGGIESVYELIEYHENTQFDDTFEKNQDLEKKLEEINTSLEKCVIIQARFFNVGVVQFKLIFQGRKKRSNERSMALSTVNVAQVPSTPYHQSFSYSNSVNLQSDGIDQIGTMIPANENNSFSQDKVAAPLSMYFDRNSNTYKSGNAQMLARLLTDIEPAEIQALPDGDLNNIPVRDMIDANKGCKTGKALPLSSQEGNPFTFGPDYIDCGSKKIVEIPVTNRSLRKFTKGQIVMLTEIGTEWIVQDFGQDSAFESSAKFGDWHFIKLIANTDTYFKDDRYYETGDFSNTITPTDYETQSRLKFYENKLPILTNNYDLRLIYGNKLNDIINLNKPVGVQSSFVPSKRYYVASIFDQLSKYAAGFAGDDSYLIATNANDANVFGDKNLQFKYAQELPGFWGPVYADGHSSLAFNTNGRDNANKTFFNVTSGVLKEERFLKDYFPQYAGNYKLHIPAECSSIFISPSAIFQNWNLLGSIDINGSGSSIHAPFYGTTIPSTKNKIQFSPLQAELAGSDDLLSTKAKNLERQFYTTIRAVVGTKLGIDAKDIKTFFGQGEGNLAKMYGRSVELLNYPSNEFLITDISQCSSPSYDNAQESFTQVGNFNSVKYDCFVKRGGVNSGLVGSPRLFRKSGSKDGGHCVGIISAKNTISKRSGGKLNYSVNQEFGLNQERASTAATTFLTIIPGIFSAGGSAGGGMEYGFPQWGSTTDNINSFGTTALHLRVFDYWPENDTIFDPRYFGILHFNPNDSSVDLPVPTASGGLTTLNLGSAVSSTTALEPKSSWRKSTLRRGMLLTGGGFKYLAHQIGLKEDSASVVYGGTGFNSNFEFEIKSKNVILNVEISNGSVTKVSIQDGSDIKCHTAAGIDSKHRGTNFLPEDFNTNVPNFVDGQLVGTTSEKAFIVNIPSPLPAPNGKAAVVKFTSGEVYFQELVDNPPVEQVPITRLTSSSKGGEGFVQEVKESDFTLDKNTSGKYDCFYHFHNDITHTLMTEQPFIAGFLQYVTMTIT